ncbi:MAG TPA: hypothetical protein VM012_15040 [Flavitalea sp.]|nr:hypothetical protein [Flavitalea sp.]
MKSHILFFVFLICTASAHAQFYYKDLLMPKQTSEQLQKYKTYKIRAIKATSSESNTGSADGIQVQQEFNQDYSTVTTISRTPSNESHLLTTYNPSGLLIKSVDTTDGASSTTEYNYDPANQVSRVLNISASSGQAIEKEEHIWKYVNRAPVSMWKIRNNRDTTYIDFILDEKGNIVEENSRRNNLSLIPYYYYYDDKGRLTDIVHYNPIAKRLLPDYIFEYDGSGKLRSMMVVPPSGDYQKWMYSYDERGLKTKEAVYNKGRQLLGTVEYRYE